MGNCLTITIKTMINYSKDIVFETPPKKGTNVTLHYKGSYSTSSGRVKKVISSTQVEVEFTGEGVSPKIVGIGALTLRK